MTKRSYVDNNRILFNYNDTTDDIANRNPNEFCGKVEKMDDNNNFNVGSLSKSAECPEDQKNFHESESMKEITVNDDESHQQMQ